MMILTRNTATSGTSNTDAASNTATTTSTNWDWYETVAASMDVESEMLGLPSRVPPTDRSAPYNERRIVHPPLPVREWAWGPRAIDTPMRGRCRTFTHTKRNREAGSGGAV